ncbi:hypothetical protein E3N88_23054 [Mikania micrantha]|uniref:Leucine-rich repeat-containing N-terminal plant-type domain-containing protein n=1 Tax=Mikania micrantha TaxID=192012 RepID=A0A5N6NDN1_9ASTR|nr:hypothetical protein E3N88_23054 [Mikania micrantha]
MVGWAHQGITIEEEEERKALLEIKASLLEFSKSYDNLLSSWVVDDGSSYCDWEMINCNSISSSSSGNSYKYIKDLSLGNIFSIEDEYDYERDGRRGMIWRLIFSLFRHFKELRRLDLSWNYIGNTFYVTTGLERLSELKKLENLNLSHNFIETNNIFLFLNELTSLKVLDLTYVNGIQGDSPTQGMCSQTASTLRKLKVLNRGSNRFNESLLSSLSDLTSLKSLNLEGNLFSGSFPFQGIRALKVLILRRNEFNGTLPIEADQHVLCQYLLYFESVQLQSLKKESLRKSLSVEEAAEKSLRKHLMIESF